MLDLWGSSSVGLHHGACWPVGCTMAQSLWGCIMAPAGLWGWTMAQSLWGCTMVLAGLWGWTMAPAGLWVAPWRRACGLHHGACWPVGLDHGACWPVGCTMAQSL